MDTNPSLNTAVVFADDEEMVLQAVSSTLERAGFVMLPPVSGSVALDHFRARKQTMDLAVIDANAEGIHPAEIVRDLHEISPKVRMLFLADEEGAEAVRNAPALGHVRDVLRKPFRRSQLLGKALEIMDRASALTA
jgi:DNA-binding NarL/FixJ family response regulator